VTCPWSERAQGQGDNEESARARAIFSQRCGSHKLKKRGHEFHELHENSLADDGFDFERFLTHHDGHDLE